MNKLTHTIEALRYKANTIRFMNKDHRFLTHYLVIESDDWGSIRMPSTEVLRFLESKGYRFAEQKGYDRYDTLASKEDLESLIDALSSVKDSIGNPAKMTMNCVVANPDFDRIRQSNYQEYHFELFTETLKRYPHHDRSFPLWREGMNCGVFHPQFHGREHLNVLMWLRLLQEGYQPIRESFKRCVFSTQVDYSVDERKHSLAAFNIADASEYDFVTTSVKEGLDIFEKLFGYRSVSMIAPNYTWDIQIENAAFSSGVKYFQGARNQRHSLYAMRQGHNTEFRYTGQRNKNNQIYMVRNCFFEPSEDPKKNADFCLAQVDRCFKTGQAAIISSHRQNFIGELYPSNRDNNTGQFIRLLKTIVTKYPDVVFVSSDELGAILDHQTRND